MSVFQNAWAHFAGTAYLLPDNDERCQLAEQIGAYIKAPPASSLSSSSDCDQQFAKFFESKARGTQILIAASIPLFAISSSARSILLTWLNEESERQLIFLENDPRKLACVLNCHKCFSLLQSSQIWMHYCASPHRDFALQLLASDVAFENFEFCQWQKSPFWENFGLELLARAGQIRGVCDELLQTPDTASYSLQNGPLQVLDADIAALRGSLQGVPALLCGAGPTLGCELELIKKSAKGALVVGCGSAALALQRAGITAHAVASICPLRASFERWHQLDLFCVPSLTCLRAFPGVADMMFGQRIHLTGLSAAPSTRWIEGTLGFASPYLDYGNSVLTATLRACLHMGCNPIYLVGVDLCYNSNGDKYAFGVEPLKAPQNAAAGVFGLMRAKASTGDETLLTNLPWLTESRFISRLAGEYPKTRIYTTSPRTLQIEGVASSTLTTWLGDKPQERDIAGHLWSCLAATQREIPANAPFDELQRSLSRCLDFFQQKYRDLPLDRAQKGCLAPKALESYLTSLELPKGQELAFDVLLRPMQGALEHFHHRKLQRLKRNGSNRFSANWRNIALLEMASQRLLIYQYRGGRLLSVLQRACQSRLN